MLWGFLLILLRKSTLHLCIMLVFMHSKDKHSQQRSETYNLKFYHCYLKPINCMAAPFCCDKEKEIAYQLLSWIKQTQLGEDRFNLLLVKNKNTFPYYPSVSQGPLHSLWVPLHGLTFILQQVYFRDHWLCWRWRSLLTKANPWSCSATKACTWALIPSAFIKRRNQRKNQIPWRSLVKSAAQSRASMVAQEWKFHNLSFSIKRKKSWIDRRLQEWKLEHGLQFRLRYYWEWMNDMKLELCLKRIGIHTVCGGKRSH